MRLTLILLFSLLFNDCFSKIIQSAELNDVNSIRPTIKFTDMNIDVQYLILDELKIDELIFIGAMNKQLNAIARSIFHRKYQDYTIFLQRMNDGEQKFQAWREQDVEPYSPFIGIFNYKLELNVLQYFGDDIQKLGIDGPKLQNERYDNVIKFAKTYAAKSVTHLFALMTLEQLEQLSSFKNVEHLYVHIVGEKNEDEIRLSNLFPKVKRLDLVLLEQFKYKWLNCEMPHLEHVKAKYVFGTASKGEPIEAMLRRNNQIRRLEIKDFPSDFVMVVHKYLPNIEHLIIDSENFQITEPIHFTNVSVFELSSYHPISIGLLTFSHLNALNMRYTSRHDDNFAEWMKFFRNHQNISKLHVHEYSNNEMSETDLIELTNSMHNLTELTLDMFKYKNPEVLYGIVQRHTKLTAFRLNVGYNLRADIIMLQERFKRDWNVRDSYRYDLWIEKKNSIND